MASAQASGGALLPPLRLAARRTDEQLRTLAFEVTVAEARERERIANGLHDELGQVLAIVGLRLAEFGQMVEDPSQRELLSELRALVAQASHATRCATFELSNPVLQQLGLQAAIESLVPRIELMARVMVSVTGRLPELRLPPQVEAVVFRAARELLANMAKHSGARQARVHLMADAQRLLVTVSDDGAGFDAAAPRPGAGLQGGYGLASADAQMQAIGGRLDIESAPGCGTRATLTLPWLAAREGK